MVFRLNSTLRVGAAFAASFLTSIPLGAQWSQIPSTGIPLTADGKPNLSAPAPRFSDGTPDLSGIWLRDTNKLVKDLGADFKAEDFPFQSWAKTLFDARAESMSGKGDGSLAREDPEANCLPLGVPRTAATFFPWKIVQTVGLIVIVQEVQNSWRQIFLDGREPLPDANPTWMGYSTGKWEGDTLVVDTRGFNGKLWLDQLGRPSTDALRVIERYRRRDFGHMEIEITIDDPKAYTKPWTVTMPVHLLPDTELMEYVCNENNRFVERLQGK